MCLPPLRSEPGERERIRSDFARQAGPRTRSSFSERELSPLEKGVDLFLACARRVAEMAPAEEVSLCLVRGGDGHGLDAKYALYLEDQVQRSGLNGVAAILKAVSDMEGCLS